MPVEYVSVSFSIVTGLSRNTGFAPTAVLTL